MQHNSYIDGIRGIAVLSVMFFHANYNFFKGGFLGVDIFFVLSGFLILASIVNGIDNNQFSFMKFYNKRFFRIVPAALFTLLIVLLLGLMILLPEELENLSKNIFSVFFLNSNILAANSIDYFGIGVEFMPIIHYWSLSIELQFYIFSPFFVYLFLKNRNEKLLLIFLLIVLIVSITYASLPNGISNNEKYFSSFMRLWEFALGASTFMVVRLFNNHISNINLEVKNLLLFLAIMLILISFVVFDNSFNVPGIATLIPTIGVSLLLMLTNDKSIIGKILSFYPLKFIGIISFSVYLVHQPVFAFYRIINDKDFEFIESLFLIILVIIISILSWSLIEKPFQSNRKEFKNMKFIIIALLMVVLVLISYKGMHKDLPQFNLNKNVEKHLFFRYDNNPMIKECRIDNKIINPEKACAYGDSNNNTEIAFWGDSHLDQIAMPLAEEFNKYGHKVTQFTVAGCPPILNVDLKNNTRECNKNSEIILKYLVKNDRIKDVIIFSYWNYYIKDDVLVYADSYATKKQYSLEESFRKTIGLLINSGKRVHVIYSAPQMKVNPPLHKARLEKLFLAQNNDIIRISELEFITQSSKSRNFLDNSLKEFTLNKIYISNFFKEKEFYIANDDNIIFYRDDNHLSLTGGYKISNRIVKNVLEYNENN